MNKTGTTSLKWAMKELDFTVGNQRKAEALIQEWANRDFKPIIRYCRGANFFQDIPFSLPYTYIAMDQAFQNSKFILTVRDSSDVWYRSVREFDYVLRQQKNIVPGYSNRLIWNTTADNVLEKEKLIQLYEHHNDSVRDYFRHRTEDLLILNVADESAYQQLCDFLGVQNRRDSFPWLNRTSEILKR